MRRRVGREGADRSPICEVRSRYDVVIAALKQHTGVLSKLADVEAADVGIPLLVVGELLFGALRSQRVEANLGETGASDHSSPFFL